MTHLELTVKDAPGVLERVVGAVRSRQCQIVALQFHAGDRHRPGRVEITLDAPTRAVNLAAARLQKLQDVQQLAYSQPRSVASSTACARSTAPSLP